MNIFFDKLEELCKRDDTIQTFVFHSIRCQDFIGLLLKRCISTISDKTYYELHRMYYIGNEITIYPHIISSFFTENENEAIVWAEKYFNEYFKLYGK